MQSLNLCKCVSKRCTAACIPYRCMYKEMLMIRINRYEYLVACNITVIHY